MRHRLALLAAAAASMFLLAGCGGSGLTEATVAPAPGSGSTGDSGSNGESGAEPAPKEPGPGSADAGITTEEQTAADSPVAPQQEREVVKTASVTVETNEVDQAADEATELATELDGRVDGDTRMSGEDDTRRAILVLRVPPDALDAVLAAIGDLGTETSREVKGEDVTAVKADIDARVQSLTASVTRLQQFMNQSGSISDLVALESALSSRQQELESMKAQQKALADQIGLATLTVTLVEPDAVDKPDDGPTGFGDALAGGWSALVSGLGWGLAGIGYALPVAVPLALLAAAAWLLIRRRRRRARAGQPA